MPNKQVKISKGDYLFKEGDSSESMYLIRSGRIAITKKSLSSDDEIVLAEKINGELIGEMAFFDSKPRSAGAQAMINSEVIELPFASLQEQFNLFPMWIKVLMKTTVGQLRDANTRIKNLENITSETKDKLSPQLLLRVCAIINLLQYKAEETEKGPAFAYKELHFYCNQVFHQTSPKINRTVKVLQSLGLLKVEEHDGSQMVVLLHPELITSFTVWYNTFLSTSSTEQIFIDEKELKPLQVLAHYGEQLTPTADGIVTLPLKEAEENSEEDLDIEFSADSVDSLIKKGVVKDKTVENDQLVTKYKAAQISEWATYWQIIHTYNKSSAI